MKKNGTNQTARKRAGRQPKSRRRVWAKRLGLTALGGFALVVAMFAVAYARTDIPDPNAAFLKQTSFVYYEDGKTVLGKFAQQDRSSVGLPEMGEYTADAAIAAEDRTFYTNQGIDPKGILRAAFSNAQGNATQGASTITQQYVKILYLSTERTYQRKVKEALLSLKIQRQQSKDEILEGYLNTIYFGRGAYGIEAASRAYFGTSAQELNLKQSAALAAVINSPNNYDPAQGKGAKAKLRSRYQYVLNGMESMGVITAEQHTRAAKKLPKFPHRSGTSNGYTGQTGYVMQQVRAELQRAGLSDQEIDGGGLRITTTINRKVMQAIAAGVEEQRPPGLKQLHVGVASVDPKTGGLRGMYAGAPYEQTQGGTNWALSGGAPGSTFKPFALAAGLSDGYSLKSTFNGNSPIEIGGIEFNNQGEALGRSYGSRVSLLTATENSVNTAFVDLTDAMDNGPTKVVDTAVRLGIPRKSPGLNPELGVALGSADIRPVDMANAYGNIADGGLAKKWYVVERVASAGGETLFKHKHRTTRAIEQDVANDVTYALQQVVESGTGYRALALGRPAAGKTGTATTDGGNVRSSWFVGYTPQLSTAVMYVRGNGQQPLNGYLPTFYGGDYPARTWTSVMGKALEGEPVEEFPPPGNVQQTAEDHQPLPTFTPRPTPTEPPKTEKPTPTKKPKPSKPAKPTPTETSASPTPTPTPTCTPPDECLGICDNPAECDDGGGGGGGGGGNGRTDPSEP